jgi:hypothetical protein
MEIPGDAAWDRIAQVYAGALQPAFQDLWVSSARIIQEHMLRAWIDASQACFNALVENAVRIQRRAVSDLVDANQKAGAIFAQDLTDATLKNAKEFTDAVFKSSTVH